MDMTIGGAHPRDGGEKMNLRQEPVLIHRSFPAKQTIPFRDKGHHLVMILKGEARLEGDANMSQRIPAGTCNLIRQVDEYPIRLVVEPDAEIIWLRYPYANAQPHDAIISWPVGQANTKTDSLQHCLLFHNPHSLSLEMQRIIRDLQHCPLEGYYLDLFVRAKATEALAYLFHDHAQKTTHTPSPPSTLREDIRERMQQVRKLLHERIDDPPSLHDLAQWVGTNENYLKIHFKQMFGTTVYGYLHTLRMDMAQQMLQEHTRPIADIARRLGYRHASHFSTVFKRHFGMSPREMKQ